MATRGGGRRRRRRRRWRVLTTVDADATTCAHTTTAARAALTVAVVLLAPARAAGRCLAQSPEALAYFNEVAHKPFAQQAVAFLNAYWPEVNAQAEFIYRSVWRRALCGAARRAILVVESLSRGRCCWLLLYGRGDN